MLSIINEKHCFTYISRNFQWKIDVKHFPEIPEKRTTCEVCRNFGILTGNYRCIDFPAGISGIVSWKDPVLKIQHFPDFLETFLGKVNCTIFPCFKNLAIFGWIVKLIVVYFTYDQCCQNGVILKKASWMVRRRGIWVSEELH